MTGELRQSPPPPGDENLEDFSPPPCAQYFEQAIAERDQDKINIKLDKATQAALGAKVISQCRNCVEVQGLIRCPLKFREDSPAKEPESSISIMEGTRRQIVTADIHVLQLPESSAAKERLLRRLRNFGVPLIAAADRILREQLDCIGFPQPDEPIGEAKVQEPHPPHQAAKTVEDPRPPEGKERDTLKDHQQPHPRCARTLSKFLVERHQARKDWKRRNAGKAEDDIKPFKHQASLGLYGSAMISAEDADPVEDCSKCLKESCPLRNGVSGSEFFETTYQRVEINGIRVKTRPRFINRLDGLPEEKMAGPPDPRLVIELMEDQMKSLLENKAS